MTATLLRASLLAILSVPLLAQPTPEGMTATVVPLPANASTPLRLPNGDLCWFDGDEVLRQAPGQPAVSLLQLPAPVFASFLVPVDGNRLLFGEASSHRLWLVPLQGPAPTQPLATATWNYDAVALDGQRALVSAKTGGFGSPDNDLAVVDLTTGATATVALLPGASGPVALAPDGDLYYATASLAFPTPPGQTSVLRLRRAVLDAAITNGTVLGLADAELVFAGLDAASDLALDDDGDLLFTDWFHNQVGELHDATGPAPWLGTPLLDHGSAPGAASLQFLPSPTPGTGVFEPFQPGASLLVVFETDFAQSHALRCVQPRQAVLTTNLPSPLPTGSVNFVVSGGPTVGVGLLAITLDTTPGLVTITLPGSEQPLGLAAALFGNAILWPDLFDAQGTLTIPVTNPGFPLPTAATAQALLLSVNGVFGVSSVLQPTFGS